MAPNTANAPAGRSRSSPHREPISGVVPSSSTFATAHWMPGTSSTTGSGWRRKGRRRAIQAESVWRVPRRAHHQRQDVHLRKLRRIPGAAGEDQRGDRAQLAGAGKAVCRTLPGNTWKFPISSARCCGSSSTGRSPMVRRYWIHEVCLPVSPTTTAIHRAE